MPFVTNLFGVMGVQNLSKSVKICHSYWQKFVATCFMLKGISHGRTVGKFEGTSSCNRRRWKIPLANGIPPDLPLLAFCNVAFGREQKGLFRRFHHHHHHHNHHHNLYWKNKQKCENWGTLTPHSSKTIRRIKGWPK